MAENGFATSESSKGQCTVDRFSYSMGHLAILFSITYFFGDRSRSRLPQILQRLGNQLVRKPKLILCLPSDPNINLKHSTPISHGLWELLVIVVVLGRGNE